MKNKLINRILATLLICSSIIIWQSCKPKAPASVAIGDAAAKSFVPPGKYDEFYNILTGG